MTAKWEAPKGCSVVRTWTPTDANDNPTGPLELIGWVPANEPVIVFVSVYGDGAADDGSVKMARDGVLSIPSRDPAGKLLGRIGYFYPEVLERRGVSLEGLK